MNIDLELAVYAIVFLAQFLLGFISVRQTTGLAERFNQVLQSKVRVAEMLEKYSRIVQPFNIKVDADIDVPAEARGSTLYVNKSMVYHYNLYSNYYCLWQLEKMSQPSAKLLQNNRLWNVAYTVQWLVLLCAVTVFPLAIYVSIAIALILIGVSLIARYEEMAVHVRTLDVLYDFADLNDREQKTAREMGDVLANSVFAYSVRWPIRVVRFLLP